VAVEYVDPGWEAHVTGFVHDPIQDPIERGDGAAAYVEKRLGNRVSLGVEGRYAHSADDARTAGGITAKYWLEPAKLLFELEGQVIHQTGKSAQGGKTIRERGEISGEETILRLTSRSGRDLPLEWTSPRIPI
jgi:hypothetical protein